MRWTADNYAGFTAGQPWLPIGQNLAACNVESQARDPHSMLSLCRRLLKLRREHGALEIGDYVGLPCDAECLSYLRRHDGRQLLVMLNFSDEQRVLSLPPEARRGRLLLSSNPDRSLHPVSDSIDLAPVEGIVLELT
jgi:alpha-glucosidase